MAKIASRSIVSIAAWLLVAQAGVSESHVQPRIGRAVRHGLSSKPLREMHAEPLRAGKSALRVVEALAAPRTASVRKGKDAVVQGQPGPSAPDALLQFDGASENDNLPFSGEDVEFPDANGAAGPDHYFQIINTVFRIFDKAGNLVLGPLPSYGLWTGLGGICSTSTPKTPYVKYDTLAGRWFVSQAAFDSNDGSTHQCIAVSTTGDPTGSYAQYDFVIGFAAGLPPHPIATNSRFGIWPEAYYMTVNQYGDSGSAGFGIYAFDRAAMLSGAPASFEYVNPGDTHPSTLWGIPSDLDGSNPPPANSPNFAVALGADFLDGSPNDVVHVWKFHADFNNPGNATLDGPVDVPIASFDALACNPSLGQGCVPQLGSSQLIQAEPNILMYRLAYRNFGDHESLVTNFTVDGAAGANRAAIRWLELRDPNGSPAVYQEGTYAPDESHRFIGSMAMDRGGNMALGYSKSDATIHPSLAVTGRLAGDLLGTMGTENAFFEGPNSRPPVVGFWGHYSSMAVDPSDDCTFWFTAEYIGEPAPFFEYSRIGSFKFASCTGGPSGVLEGTVTEAGSGNPVAAARVTAGASETLTDSSGHYQFLTLPVGTYDMMVTKFGLVPGAASGVVVTDGGTTVQDFVLDVAPQALLNGVVLDGSGADWPLYALLQITAPGYPGAKIFTDPVTGYYAITLVTGISYTIAVNAVTPGYGPVVLTLPLDGAAASSPGGIVQNFSLTIDATTCNAPGYAVVSDGVTEHFDAGELPPGWNVVNNGFGPWTIHTGPDCGFFAGNNTGGSGPFALVDSACDGEVSDDTELVTPSVDLSGDESAQVRFAQDFPGAGEIAEVDVSTDGGLAWTNVFHQTSAARGPNTQAVDITAVAAGQSDVRARFHYFNAFNAAWWQVDDVVLGQASCAASSGGLLVGNASDANTGAGLNGATVENLPQPGSPLTTTFATPEDPAQPDGLYILFSGSGSQPFRASLDPYVPLTQSTTIIPNSARRLDFHLTAGRLDAAPRPLSARVDPGEIVGMTLDMTNTGTTDATFQIDELNVTPLSGPMARGPFADPDLRASLLARIPTRALRDASNAKHLPVLPGLGFVQPLTGGNVLNAYPTTLAHAWGVAFNTDADDFWLSNNLALGGDDRDYRYLTDGTLTGDSIDDRGWAAEFAADGAYNPRTGMLWRVNVGGDDCIYELDPVAKTATGNRICPSFGTSERGLAYNPADDTYYAGSWNDGVIQHFDSKGTILDSVYVAVPISGLAFNSSNGRLYALTNHGDLQGFDVYVFDTHDHYAVIGAFFITSGGVPVLGMNAGAGMEIDCNGHLWLVDELGQTIYEAETEETGVCAFNEIPWLSEDPAEGTVSASATLPVTCTFDSTGLTPGLRQAQLMFHTDTPYPVAPVPVDFTVRFLDVLDASNFESYIYGAAGARVMPGCDPAGFLFCPSALVTRADMAGFILRAVHGAAFVPAPYAGAFADVHAGDYNADYIQSFFEEGFTVGCGGGNFCPDAVHTRGQAAVFILKGTHGPSYAPPSCASTHVFDDVPCPPTPAAPFGDWIGQLFLEQITAGCGGNSFCPDAGIPNEQMATFLVKAFHIPHL